MAWDEERADAAEQLLVAVEEPVVELRAVEELVGDLGVRECLLVVLPLDDDFGVGEEEVAAAVVGVQVGVDDVCDVRDPEADLGESPLEPVLGLHPREHLVGVVEAEAVRRIVDVRGMQAGVDEDVFVVVGADQIDRHRDIDQHAVVDPGREDSSLVDPQRAGRNHVQPHRTRPAFHQKVSKYSAISHALRSLARAWVAISERFIITR